MLARSVRYRVTLGAFVAGNAGAPCVIHAQTFADRANRMLARLEQLPRHTAKATRYPIKREMARLHVPGASLAIVADGSVVWAGAFGVKDSRTRVSVDTATLFLAGSLSKPVFATGALALVEGGMLKLDGNVDTMLRSWHLPASRFTASEKVTLRRLLTHSAGLTVSGFRGYRPGELVPTVPQLLDGRPPANTPAVRNDTAPAVRWSYSGGGFMVAQLLATDATGESFPAMMRRLVFSRADMPHSTYENPLPRDREREAASGHEPSDTVIPGRWKTYPEMAAAGLWTTASDLGRWGIAVMRAYRGDSGGVLSPSMSREMLRRQVALPKTGPGPRSTVRWWGLGVEVADSARNFNFTHGGKDEGFVSIFIFFPARNTGFVALTNAANVTFVNELMRAFIEEFIR